MAKIKAEITAKGTVQKVGYRDYVQEKARKLSVKGYVENLRDGSVRIVCETGELPLNKLRGFLLPRSGLLALQGVEV